MMLRDMSFNGFRCVAETISLLIDPQISQISADLNW